MIELFFDTAAKLSWLDYVMLATVLVVLLSVVIAIWKAHHKREEFNPPSAPRLLVTVVRLRTGGGFEYAQRLESSVTNIAANEVLINVQPLEPHQLTNVSEQERVL